MSLLDADGYAEAWDESTLALNLHRRNRLDGKLQISHRWNSNRSGVPANDFQETRLQIQYDW